MRHRARAVVVCSLASALAAGCSRPARLSADLVITRAKVWTGEPQQPEAMAVAVIGDRIVDVGGADDIEHWRGRSTTVVNAEGRRLIPGFNDAHVHFVEGGIDLDRLDLGDAGITEKRPDPPGGTIVRDAHGNPTGLLTEAATDLVARIVPRMTAAERMQAVKRALQYAAALGVTSVQDMNASSDDVAAYADLANRGELTVRVYAALADAAWYDQARLGLRRGFGSPSLRLGAVNGSVGDVPIDENRRTRLMAADHAGLQVCLDVRSESAAAAALDLVEAFIRADGDRD